MPSVSNEPSEGKPNQSNPDLEAAVWPSNLTVGKTSYVVVENPC
jgi:hypothetical protein